MPKPAILLCLLAAPALLTAQPPALTNSVGMEFVLAPEGSFVMGKFTPACAPAGLQDNVTEAQHAECVKMARAATLPGFKATVPRPFYVGKFEVTQEQYRKIMGRNPSHFTAEKVSEPSDNYPVESVTWEEAQAFIRKLNAAEKTKAYRLPTEAEWEYAARAGTEDDFQGAKRQEVAWYQNNSKWSTHPVGKLKPNAWGIHDMLGNVWEWVQDWYNERVQPAGPKGPSKGKAHVLRGGAFNSHEKNIRVPVHTGSPGSVINTGFRVVKEVK
jgi:formylglycine-generating enzyme required for sulfatase activity